MPPVRGQPPSGASRYILQSSHCSYPSPMSTQKTKCNNKPRRYGRAALRHAKIIAQTLSAPTPICNPESRPKFREKKQNATYQPYWSEEQLKAGVENGTVISGHIRINPKNFGDSYIKHPSGDADIYICGLLSRNRALPNDIVAVQVDPKKDWRVFDTYVSDSVTPETSEDNAKNKRQKYVRLEDFLTRQRHDLEQLLGIDMVRSIAADLESSADPSCTDIPGDKSVINYAHWWSILQRTAHVVGILHPLHSRACIGYLKVQNSHSNANDKERNGQPKAGEAEADISLHTPKPKNATTSRPPNSWLYATLMPADSRLPRLVIPRDKCPEAFQRHPEDYKYVRYVARIVQWSESSIFPKGELLRSLSTENSNLIDEETDRILIGAGFIDGIEGVNNFPDSVTATAQEAIADVLRNWDAELSRRRDLRNYCVFTIDPSTARDLDDALHIRTLETEEIESLVRDGHPNAKYEVGVHIADVSYFVRPDSALDVEASRRATTIYLVQLCVPMLPRMLCEELCSLNAGEDKLAFSTLFNVSEDGEILTSWFGRTVIRSCSKLSYEDAQVFIDEPDADLTSEGSPTVEKPHTLESVRESIVKLNELAVMRRKRRFLGGALRLDQVRPTFALDDEKRLPIGVSPVIYKSSNSLVEEWMLAANEAVARHLAANLPKTAFLRRHAPPSLKQLEDASANLGSVGIKVDTDTAGSIQASICQEAGVDIDTGYRYSKNLTSLCADDLVDKLESVELSDPSSSHPSDMNRTRELEREARLLVAVSMLTKSMNLAEYFCLGELPKDSNTLHYALNMQLYTHFTSPIRRYADIIVHRELASILADSALKTHNDTVATWYAETGLPKEMSTKALQSQAEVCNSKKLSGRLAGEESAELFYTIFVKESGPLTEVCAVTAVLDRSFDVLLLSCGLTRRVYLNDLDLKTSEIISPRRVAGRVQEVGKLCLLWNSNFTEDGKSPDKISGDIVVNGAGNVVQCLVSVREPEAKNSAENGTEEQFEHSEKLLPKLRVTLIRPTCAKCQ
ncbi:unnamed protein product [Calicophoron daubneyi]|uniref:RNB domain-containing protein n=1 Tax=Calicophoron daubneyi TaxID=300641 RepID=A0AAV2TAX7_CALDB